MLRTTDHGLIRELTLDHPPVNALRLELLEALASAVEAARGDEVQALVLSGRTGCFSAGLDVPHLLELEREQVTDTFKALFDCTQALGTSGVPVVAAVGGHAPAGGAVLAIFCDYRVMAEGAFKIGFNEVQVGLAMPPIIQAAICRVVGPYQAERLCVEAQLLDPRDAKRIGLVDELAAPEEVVHRALEWCRRLISLPPNAMKATRALARADLVQKLEDPFEIALEDMAKAWFDEETQTALHRLASRLKA